MEVRLQAYEGPLDLLLYLIGRNEINIYDIPIAQLTDQYLEALREIEADMEQMSEFLVMAATLLEIKSRMLLPEPPKYEEEESDPREALVRKLLEYKRCQALAACLSEMAGPVERLAGWGERELLERFSAVKSRPVLDGVPLEALFAVFSDVIKRREARIDHVHAGYGEMPRERFTVAEKLLYITDYLRKNKRFKLSALLKECVSRGEMVVTFLALLEMMRQNLISVRQDKEFSDIECTGG